MKLANFRLIAAAFTPMKANASLNLTLVCDQAEHLVSTGIRGVFVAGTTGEGQSLTIEERMSLAETWASDKQRHKLQFFVHVGHNCQDDAIRLAHHAASVKADTIAVHAPSWFKQQTLAGLIEFCVPIAAAAPDLPFYLYDIPQITGINASSASFLTDAKGLIPNLTGIKYTNRDLSIVQECIQLDKGGYDILWGTDQALLAGIALGAAGAVGSTYNFAAPLYQRILRAVEADDWQTARAEQARVIAMVRALQQFDSLAALKYAMRLAGIDCGPVRPPVRNLSVSDQDRLRTDLERIQCLKPF
jgi:N-acetylneuraminate lyase